MYKAAPWFSGGDPSLAGREATDLSASTTHGASDLFSFPYIGSGTRPTTNIHEQRTSTPPRCASSPLERVRPGRFPPNLYCSARYARPRVPRSLHLIRLSGGSVVLPLCHVVMRFLFLRQDTSVFLQRGGLCETHRIRKRSPRAKPRTSGSLPIILYNYSNCNVP